VAMKSALHSHTQSLSLSHTHIHTHTTGAKDSRGTSRQGRLHRHTITHALSLSLSLIHIHTHTQQVPKAVEALADKADFIAWIENNDNSPPKLVKICDEHVCRFLPGHVWDEVSCVDICVQVCCSVLQCGVECCSALMCAAVCCSVLQCVAVCCK